MSHDGSNKSPLETYGKKSVFTAQQKREKSSRRRKLLLLLFLIVLVVVIAWFGYKAAVSGENPFIDPFSLPVPKK